MAPGSGKGPYGGLQFKAAVLNSTNYFRDQHQVGNLTWDPKLARFARKHAQKCVFEHSGGPYGENLANKFPDPTTAIDAWYAEEQDYNYEKQKFSESAGHHTQLVWKNTTKVGCGAANCNSDAEQGSNGWLFVCEYDPAGNVVGEFGRNVRKGGMDEDGTPGFGVASSMTRSSGLLIALVALSSLAAVCL
ncbi:hypothetical protein LTR37_016103 [Vermiconidia calcicola]|uniref:Uncharacterized protein n=1 Tax=Vermiconidia calcicola TaxID=1690605 RepID=A0ACC3MPB9_9PEZI|nr:hypothetical protein LTR37_016103 [Vermiconidia calcicola]